MSANSGSIYCVWYSTTPALPPQAEREGRGAYLALRQINRTPQSPVPLLKATVLKPIIFELFIHVYFLLVANIPRSILAASALAPHKLAVGFQETDISAQSIWVVESVIGSGVDVLVERHDAFNRLVIASRRRVARCLASEMLMPSSHSKSTDLAEQKTAANVIGRGGFEAGGREWGRDAAFEERRIDADTTPLDRRGSYCRAVDLLLVRFPSVEVLVENALDCSAEVECPRIEAFDGADHVVGAETDQDSFHGALHAHSCAFLPGLDPSIVELFIAGCRVVVPLNYLDTFTSKSGNGIRESRISAEVARE